MADFPEINIDEQWILSLRGSKNPVDPFKPYACIKEKERTATGGIEEVATIFLTNKECPFKCLMCDLWKNTTDEKLPAGIIPGQIEWGLNRLQPFQHIKLYNSGNFFDAQAIPREDYAAIAGLVSPYKSVIVENHPNLVNDRCVAFRDLINTDLEMAMGLETIHPEVLDRLNKKMNLEDVEQAVHFLKRHGIRCRAFILLKPPFLTESEGVEWAKKSIDKAFTLGFDSCVMIPTRSGNGALDLLEKERYFSPPTLYSLEEVLEYGISLNRGRVFADLWDLQLFSDCDECLKNRIERLSRMNLVQEIQPEIQCECF